MLGVVAEIYTCNGTALVAHPALYELTVSDIPDGELTTQIA